MGYFSGPLLGATLAVATASQMLTTDGGLIARGTVLHVRLTSAVSSQTGRPGDEVTAVLIAPVPVAARRVPAHTRVAGQIESVIAHRIGHEARLRLNFDRLEFDGRPAIPMVTRVIDVDNARERVSADGDILGPRTQADSGWGRLELLGLAVLVPEAFVADAAGSRIIEGVRVDVAYGPGVEFDLEMTSPLDLRGVDLPREPPLPVLPASLAAAVKAAPLRTGMGDPPRPADLINVVLVGSTDALTDAFLRAGWSTADARGARADLKAFLAIAGREGYKDGPVSNETLDGRRPDAVFEKQTNTFARRHHVRLWRHGSWQGQTMWVAAGTHDVGVKFDAQARTFTHRVEPDIDRERDKIVNDLSFAGVAPAAYLARPTVPRVLQNATQDEMVTDGRVAVISLPGS